MKIPAGRLSEDYFAPVCSSALLNPEEACPLCWRAPPSLTNSSHIRQNSDVSVTSVTLTLPRLYEVG